MQARMFEKAMINAFCIPSVNREQKDSIKGTEQEGSRTSIHSALLFEMLPVLYITQTP